MGLVPLWGLKVEGRIGKLQQGSSGCDHVHLSLGEPQGTGPDLTTSPMGQSPLPPGNSC